MEKTGFRKSALVLGMLWAVLAGAAAAWGASPIVIGLDADMSSGSGLAGRAIERGARIAIAEINEAGGLLGGRALELRIRDHHGSPVRSTDNLEDFAATEDLTAVIAGLHSPAIIQNMEFIHRQELIILDPWAAATSVIDNGHRPNYVFRISVRDQHAGGFLVEQSLFRGYKRLGILLERTGWGRSNERALTEALAARGLSPAAVLWFNWGETEMMEQILALESAGADAVILVANAPEGATLVRNLAMRPPQKRLPLFSHWGLTGGDFPGLAGEALAQVRLEVLQTYSFIGRDDERAKRVIARYKSMFGAKDARDIFAPVGTAHAYDLVHLLALAIEKAGTLRRAAVRDALEEIDAYRGLIRDYRPPFTAERHEGLDPSDYRLAVYGPGGALLPSDNAP